MDPDFLPINECALSNVQSPANAISAGQIGTLGGLHVSECLLDVWNNSIASLADECSERQLRSDFRSPGHGSRDRE